MAYRALVGANKLSMHTNKVSGFLQWISKTTHTPTNLMIKDFSLPQSSSPLPKFQAGLDFSFSSGITFVPEAAGSLCPAERSAKTYRVEFSCSDPAAAQLLVLVLH